MKTLTYFFLLLAVTGPSLQTQTQPQAWNPDSGPETETLKGFEELELARFVRYAKCQDPRTRNVLDGCPEGTVYVSDSDERADFRRIQDAIDSLSSNMSKPQTILIGAGLYAENVTLYTSTPASTSDNRIVLLGQTSHPMKYGGNLVEVQREEAIIDIPGASNINTSTLAIDGPAIVNVHNLNITNTWPSTNHSAALALGINKGNLSLYGCSFKSFQDTFFVGSKGSGGNVWMGGGEVRGQTDFLFGMGRLFLQSVHIGIRNTGDMPLAGIVAWQGPGTEGATNGAYIRDSVVDLAPDHNTTHDLTGTMALGRPWNNYSMTVYIDTYMGGVVNASGFTAWAGKVFTNVTYAEYGSYGPGYQPSKRLLDQEVLGSGREGRAKYGLGQVFGGNGILDWA